MVIQAVGGKATAWLWDKYGSEIAETAREGLKKFWAEVQWIEAAEKYRARMRDLHGTLRVIGKPQPVSLEGIFTDVFILDKPHAFRRFDVAHLREDPAMLERAERISGLRLVTQPGAHRLFILGPPGAGKTTFLKYLTLQAAQGKLDKIPIFVGLNEWSEPAAHPQFQPGRGRAILRHPRSAVGGHPRVGRPSRRGPAPGFGERQLPPRHGRPGSVPAGADGPGAAGGYRAA